MAIIDLSKLPAPQFVEELAFEQILAEMLADTRVRAAAKGVVIDTVSEADPLYIGLEVAAYRELLVRQRGNEEGKALLLAYAQGTDLDHIGITYYDGEERLLVQEADPEANPPTDAVYEDDDSFKERLLLKDDSYSTAGATNAYKFHARSADGSVKDVSVDSPTGGTTVVYVLSRKGNGEPDEALLETVRANLDDEDKRPMSEELDVRAAEIVEWSGRVVLDVPSGPDRSLALQAAKDAMDAYRTKTHRLEATVAKSGIFAAVHVPGVKKATLTGIAGDLVCAKSQAPYCTQFEVELAEEAQ